jgi:hypothetical protein
MIPIQIGIEQGEKKTFASAFDWPGWSRSGREEKSALQNLFDYAYRYKQALQGLQVPFDFPGNLSDLEVSERLAGSVSTDFGVPAAIFTRDGENLGEKEFDRLITILQAGWQTFDRVVESASGKILRKGPRGGGRNLDEMVAHVREAELTYLSRLGRKFKKESSESLFNEQERIRLVIRETLNEAAAGKLPKQGPRGGVFWTPRYFIRRAAWHILDHAWEIEDRIE